MPQCYKRAGQPFGDFFHEPRRINRRDAIASMAAARSLAPRVLRAQAGFPNRPIRIVVPVAPGGGVDTFARLIAAKVKTQRDVTSSSRTAPAATRPSAASRCSAPRRTATRCCSTPRRTMSRDLVLKNAPYDPVTDFTPIALAGETPLVHIIANNRPEKTVAEIVAAAKADTRQMVVRDRAARRAGPSRRRCVQPIQRPQPADHPLSRHRAGGERRGRRPCADDDRGDPVAAAAGARRQRPRGRRHQQEAQRRSRRRSRP